jgi:DNA polymerase
MLVGEGPGRNEDLKGTPFVGAAGKFLDELLRLIGLKREEIFITNIVKCRPPGNRDPLPDEVAACLPYLRRQTRIIKPSLICTLGNSATRTLTDPDSSISRVHGSFVAKKGFTFCALYHPAAALYNGSLRQVQEADFIKLGEYLKKNVPGEER